MQQRTWRRRNYFIGKEFQGKFVLQFFLAILIGAVVFTAIFSVLSAHTLTVTYEDFSLRLDRTPKALFFHIVRAYGLYILLLGGTVSVISLFVSHRIAGPLYRFERSVEEITKGNLAFCIILRKRDEGKKLAGLMNTMLETLSGRLTEIRRYVDVAHNDMAVISERAAGKDIFPEEIKARISSAMDSVENLKKSLSFFTLDKG